jgi:hypothetical protein
MEGNRARQTEAAEFPDAAEVVTLRVGVVTSAVE